jgi:hypothetical protein
LQAGEELEEGDESDMRAPLAVRARGHYGTRGFAGPEGENGKRKEKLGRQRKREGRWVGLEKEKRRRKGKIRGLNFLFLFMILKASQLQTKLCHQN